MRVWLVLFIVGLLVLLGWSLPITIGGALVYIGIAIIGGRRAP